MRLCLLAVDAVDILVAPKREFSRTRVNGEKQKLRKLSLSLQLALNSFRTQRVFLVCENMT